MDKISIMQINFTKMHGLGNDFMVVDNTRQNLVFSAEQVRHLADRHFGVGFDQLLVVEHSHQPQVDFRYVIFNADGSEVEQCGNGARCFARFVQDRGLTNNNPVVVETHSGVISLMVNADQSVRVDMGAPMLDPEQVPLLLAPSEQYEIEGYTLGALSMGNPHCVLLVDELDTMEIEPIAQRIQQSELLPNQANIGFMQVLNPGEVKLRVYERGAGETLACGSGACAAVVFGVNQGLLDNQVITHLRGGDARIEYQAGGSVFLSGPAEFVFEGQVNID